MRTSQKPDKAKFAFWDFSEVRLLGFVRSLPGVGVPSSRKIASSTTMGAMTVQPIEITEDLNRPLSQERLARDVTRLAYVAEDGTRRNVPNGFTWNGSQIVM